MEVKEAIKLIDKIDDWLTNWQDDADSGSLSMDTLYIIDNIPKIKIMLQQGEKCKEYLKRILKRFNKIELADSGMNEETYRENMSSLLSDIACEIEQKYFPKEAKSDGS